MEPKGSLPHLQVPATCPYPQPDQSSPFPPHPTSWRSILILSSHLHLDLPSGICPSGFSTKPSPPPHMCYMSHPSHSSQFDHQNKGVQVIKLLIVCVCVCVCVCVYICVCVCVCVCVLYKLYYIPRTQFTSVAVGWRSLLDSNLFILAVISSMSLKTYACLYWLSDLIPTWQAYEHLRWDR